MNTLIKELYKFIYSLKKYINKHKVPYNMEIFDNKKIRNYTFELINFLKNKKINNLTFNDKKYIINFSQKIHKMKDKNLIINLDSLIKIINY